MIKNIKLKDLTVFQYVSWLSKNCKARDTCNKKCIFHSVTCNECDAHCWINNKDIFNDTFLNQEIKVEVNELLEEKERLYLETALEPFKDRLLNIIKLSYAEDPDYEYIKIILAPPIRTGILKLFNDNTDKLDFVLVFPIFKHNTMYNGLNLNYKYTPLDLALWDK